MFRFLSHQTYTYPCSYIFLICIVFLVLLRFFSTPENATMCVSFSRYFRLFNKRSPHPWSRLQFVDFWHHFSVFSLFTQKLIYVCQTCLIECQEVCAEEEKRIILISLLMPIKQRHQPIPVKVVFCPVDPTQRPVGIPSGRHTFNITHVQLGLFDLIGVISILFSLCVPNFKLIGQKIRSRQPFFE